MNRIILRFVLTAICGWSTLAAASASASPHEIRLSLHEGKLHAPDLASAICREFHLPTWEINDGNIDLSGFRGSTFVRAVNAALGDGCRLSVDCDVLILRVDATNLPARFDDVRRVLRIFIAEAAPQATARQARHWGLFLPDAFDSRRPLVVLVHGLDSEKECMGAIGNLLTAAGHQVSYFDYPQDQPIEESSELFADRMTALVERFPKVSIDIVAHSMGGLIARDYIEGGGYRGGVDRLILVGTPNAGSDWAPFGVVLKVKEQYNEWKHDPDWGWTWAITAGLSEADRDLKPGSKFLGRLNSLPRRPGVRYTVIAGTQAPTVRMAAAAVEGVAHCLPGQIQAWPIFSRCDDGLAKYAERLRRKTSDGDGPVKVNSAKLAGVDDIVLLTADHCTLISMNHGLEPAAWEAIRARLEK
ncbi:MAG TPA: alpha/beta fold hydrolase [Tepidisphaeraceae bacterium]|jgi:pimeloyl-ACP methyl ester carboxylesterase|nr:alpha/beta fold hydrolase [Tepidisphaeraceae bacterium]